MYNFGIEDGLSQRDVYKIHQDDNGFLWVATKKGLDRYDGHQFTHWYTGDEKGYVQQGFLYDFIIGNDDKIRLSSGNALIKIDPQTEQADTLDIVPNGNQTFWINHLCQGGLDRIWTTKFNAADSTSWLQRTNEEGKLTDVAPLLGNYPSRPIIRNNGHILVGGYENEIWVFDLDGKQVEQYEFPAPTNNKSYSRVIQIQATPDGTIWALLDHGQIYSMKPGASSFSLHSISSAGNDDFRSSTFWVENNGDIWMGGLISTPTNERGSPCSSIQPGPVLLHYNEMSRRTEDFSYFLKQALPYAEAPRQIFQDRTGTVWIATPFGLVRMVENNMFERYMSDGNDCCRDGICSMRGITEDEQGNIYFAYYSSIHVLNPSNGSLVPLFSKQINVPYFILYDRGHIYTGEGLRINLRSLEIDTIAQGLAGAEGAVAKSRDGTIWFGTRQKLVSFDPVTSAINIFSFPEDLLKSSGFQNITYLLPAQEADALWVATRESGIFKVHKKRGVISHLHTTSEPPLPHNRILGLFEKNGSLWIASAAGLGQYKIASDQIKVFTTTDGLPNNFINGLLPEGDSAVWVSTDNGLSRIDLASLSCSNFFHADGLSNNEFNRSSFHLAKDGRMYFGGINGINAFYPNARYGERRAKMNSRLLFSKFSKYDGEEDISTMSGLQNGKPLTLSYLDETFTFHYALADYTEPKTHQYSYMLEGYNNVWSEPTMLNFARFVNIPPGTYTFRVRASRGKSDWVRNELAIPVIVKQAFYKTTLFKIAAFGFAVLLLVGFMRYRLFLAQKHEQELETLVQERTYELETEKAKSDELLLNILPADTAEELKQFGSAKARRHENVTVMFTDFKGFSFIARKLDPEELVAEIDHCFRAFDKIIEECGLEKIKTVGDAYLCGGGLHNDAKGDAAVRVIKAALKIQDFLGQLAQERKAQGRPCFEARIGIHSGPVVGGIVGIKKFAYDIWGDTVNISERLQSNGEVGKVNISRTTFQMVKEHFHCTYRGKVEAKHQGEIDMYFVEK